jgi:hypothetical protein
MLAGLAVAALALLPASAGAQIRGSLLEAYAGEDTLQVSWTLERNGWVSRWPTGFSLVVHGEGEGGLAVWGSLGRLSGRPFTVVSSPPGPTGTGTRADPFVLRRVLHAGARLEVVEELRHVDGDPRIVARYQVRNLSAAPVTFRASAFATFDGVGRSFRARAVAELGDLRRIGGELPEGGVPLAPDEQYLLGGSQLGQGFLLAEMPSSRWSHAALGPREELIARVSADGSLPDTYASGYVDDAAAAAQWDRPPLQPGATELYEVAFVATNELWAGAGLVTRHPSCPFALRITTAYARLGPRPGRPVTVSVPGSDQYEADRTYRTTTDAAGSAKVVLHARHAYGEMDGWGAFFDRDGDARWDDLETGRGGVLTWDPVAPACPSLQRAHPRLRILRATIRGRRLRVRGRIAAAATGRVRVVWRARERRRSTAVRPRAGRIRATLRLPRGAQRLRRQRVTLVYRGDRRYARDTATRRVRRARR